MRYFELNLRKLAAPLQGGIVGIGAIVAYHSVVRGGCRFPRRVAPHRATAPVWPAVGLRRSPWSKWVAMPCFLFRFFHVPHLAVSAGVGTRDFGDLLINRNCDDAGCRH